MSFAVFGLFAVLMLLRVPIAFALAISSLVIFYFQGFNLITLTQRMFSGLDSTTLIAIPGFIFRHYHDAGRDRQIPD
jgi:C4-dicarboxylate transporter DctM subunit